MHSTATHNEFLRLRVQGLSLASIGRRLGVSKPTLIAWNRQSQPEIDTRIAQDQQRFLKSIDDTVAEQLADLTRRYNFLKQELVSRSLRNIPTSHIETLAGEYNQKIQNLKRDATLATVPHGPAASESSGAPHSNAPDAPPACEPIRT